MRAAIRRKVGPEPIGPQVVARATIEMKKATGRLLPHVDSYFLYQCAADEFERTERVDLGQIRFLLEGEGEVTYPDGHVERSKPIMVCGPGTAAAHYKLRGPVRCFGVTLRAVGWKALIGLPAHKFTDHNIDGSRLFCEKASILLNELRGMHTLDQMISALAPLLIMRQEEVKPVPEPHFPFLEAVREWAASEDPSIDELYAAISETSGLGERQVQRLCLEYFGNSPAKLKRKFRAVRAAMQIYQGAPMRDVVGPFSDQSHMINEVKHFTGHTPTSLRSGVDPVLAVTLGDTGFRFLPEVFPEEVDLRRN
jgi:AraC-like DNA-binding protein